MMNLESKEVNKAVKSARTTKSNNARRRPKGGVSDVRGNSDSNKDLVSGLRLPRVRKVNAPRGIREMGKSKQGVRESPVLTGVERQIAKLNAYRSLLKKKILLKGVPKDIHDEIMKEHMAWVKSQVLVMLGQGSSPGFTQDEVDTLKKMVERVKSKLNQHTKATERPLGPPASQPPQYLLQPRTSPEPLLSDSAKNAQPMIPLHEQGNRISMNQVNITGADPDQMRIVEAARKLEAMEAEGPTF
jgi:hypothetical protein